MKSLSKLFVGALVVTAVSAFVPSSAFAQASDTEPANASANIIAPLTLTNVTDLVFGDIVPNTILGSVTMSTAGTITGSTGGVTAIASTRNAATFTVAGETGRAFTVTPVGIITITNVAGPPMTINSVFDCGGGPCTLVAGAGSVRVAGTLNVGPAQPAALYTGLFNVTVTYN